MIRRLAELDRERRAALLPPKPRQTVGEWAETHFWLSPRAAAEPGPISFDRAPYAREILTAMSAPGRVVLMLASQVAKTTMMLAAGVFYAVEESAPVLWVAPNLQMARDLSSDRLTPLFDASPTLRGRLLESNRRETGNTILHKSVVRGGAITLVGANSPSGLSSRPIRVLLCDEVDGYPPTAGAAGDTVALAEQRQASWYSKLTVLASTPSLKGGSRIEDEYTASTQDTFHVPCRACGAFQPITWKAIRFERDAPDGAAFACAQCQHRHPESAKAELLARGRWVAQFPERPVRGFHLNGLYSPWVSWGDRVRHFLTAKDNGMLFKVFLNSVLCETFDPHYEGNQVATVTLRGLQARREPLPEVPAGVGVLTGAVDVQDDRLEALVVGWGVDDESWLLRHAVFDADPRTDAPWTLLDELRNRQWRHALGGAVDVAQWVIDSGFLTPRVRAYCRECGRRVRAIIGGRGDTCDIATPPRHGVVTVGVHKAKLDFLTRLRKVEPGAGYVHLSDTLDDEFVAQLLAERLDVRARKFVKVRDRNEALDLAAYATAAWQLFPFRTRLEEILASLATPPAGPAPAPADAPGDPLTFRTEQLARIRNRRSGAARWVQAWR